MLNKPSHVLVSGRLLMTALLIDGSIAVQTLMGAQLLQTRPRARGGPGRRLRLGQTCLRTVDQVKGQVHVMATQTRSHGTEANNLKWITCKDPKSQHRRYSLIIVP